MTVSTLKPTAIVKLEFPPKVSLTYLAQFVLPHQDGVYLNKIVKLLLLRVILHKMVVFPALSSPMIIMRICSYPTRPLNNFEKMNPILIFSNLTIPGHTKRGFGVLGFWGFKG